MNLHEASQFLEASKVSIDMGDDGDAIEIGLKLGLIGLRHLGNEMSGTFGVGDIRAMRRKGHVVQSIAFGQAVFEAIPISELEV